jgi:hypothetical protein
MMRNSSGGVERTGAVSPGLDCRISRERKIALELRLP